MHDSPSPFGTFSALSGAVISALAVLLIGFSFGASGDPAAAPPGLAAQPASGASHSAYVSDVACAGCHAVAYDAWRTSHHFHAMEVPDEASVRGDFGGAAFVDAHARYRFFRRDGRYFVEVAGGAGAVEHEVRYTFGWEPLQQYLVEGERGRLQALTIAWDTKQGRWFDLAERDPAPPGDPLHWTGREFTWNFRCADCHSTDLQRHYDVAADRYETTFANVNVGCQACHGPGRAHVAWASGDRKASDKGLVAAPGESTRAQLDTCARCHSRRRPITEVPVPGAPFLDHFVPDLLGESLYFSDGQIRDEVFEYGSFVQSRMHRSGVVCSDCHNPHSGALHADGNAVCVACHNETPPERFASIRPLSYDSPAHHFHEQGKAGSFCVDCHMPARTYMRVDPRRDHSLRVPRPDLSAATGAPDACTGCHSDRNAAWAAARIAEWYGPGRRQEPHYGEALALGRKGAPGSGAALAALAGDTTQPSIARATAVEMLQRHLDQETGPAVAGALADPDPLVRMAALRTLEAIAPGARVDLAAPLLDDPVRSVRITAARALAAVSEAALPEHRRAAHVRASEEYVASELAAAERPESHLNLGLYWAERGDIEKSEAAYRTALRLAPDFIPAMINLAELKRAQGQNDDEARLIEQARDMAPGDASALHALGLLRVRQGRQAEALPLLASAAAMAPGSARYAYVHAVALESLGQADAARAAYMTALQRHPYDVNLLAALLQLQLRSNDRDAARSTLDHLIELRPRDAGLARLKAQLGGR
ncbi:MULTISPECIES: tetratricopeptide repeat protein [unclassified Chelatococcus]|uniref:tetratricopeptide repeat protein n=1 Tax=unclassified Chelatococcus TaxID=2638111 RepID=UPI00031EDCA2|nr:MULTISPECIES: tetratricopeptide repeat protein [unclassified Chelatococcus]